jgi:hypothetical protein
VEGSTNLSATPERPACPKLRELSKELTSNNMPLDKYRLQLLAAITTLSDDELKALAQLIFHSVGGESTDTK